MSMLLAAAEESRGLLVAEMFGPTFQGEGPSSGQHAVFIRLSRCNLSCRWCDTPYTWDWSRVGDERRICGVGDVVVVPPHTPHGFHTYTEVTLEVVAEQGIGTYYPTRGPDGTRRYVAAFRPNLPWNPPPPDREWTSDDDYERILEAIDERV